MIAPRARGKRSGFTLIEIGWVVILVSLLMTIASIGVKHARARARFAVFMSDMRQVKIGATRFQYDLGFFPPDVWRNVDPGLITKYGWRDGGHSGKWEQVDLSRWKGPYLEEWKNGWKRNPWGGLYDWDNYEPGYDYMGIPGGAVYMTLKPSDWGGTTGLPPPQYEDQLEEEGIDKSSWPGVVACQMGRYPNSNANLAGGH